MREEEERSMLFIWGGTKVRASFVLNRVFSPNILVYTFFFFFLSNLQHFFFCPFQLLSYMKCILQAFVKFPMKYPWCVKSRGLLKIPLFCTIWGPLINLFLSLSLSSGLCCEDRAGRAKIMEEGSKGMTNRRKVLLAWRVGPTGWSRLGLQSLGWGW